MVQKIYTAIGLMSGTSLDGIDAALIRTDGHGHVERVDFHTEDYDPAVRDSLRACLGLKTDPDGRVKMAERIMTLAHAEAVKKLLQKAGMSAADIDLVGFHGQTIFHEPASRFTWQIGDGALLAKETGITVINDFRSADVAAGGQGAPFLPLYHQAVVSNEAKPVAILNLGGVANVTYIDDKGILAFDTGPASALINDWVKAATGAEYDKDGALAQAGVVDQNIVNNYLSHPYFNVTPPKSLDRDQWTTKPVQGLSTADGAATLTAFTVQSIAKARDHLPQEPKAWYVTGGGRHNKTMMAWLQAALGVPVKTVDDLKLNGDSMEAEGFAYLGVRAAEGLHLSVPTTTGVPQPVTGGRRWSP